MQFAQKMQVRTFNKRLAYLRQLGFDAGYLKIFFCRLKIFQFPGIPQDFLSQCLRDLGKVDICWPGLSNNAK